MAWKGDMHYFMEHYTFSSFFYTDTLLVSTWHIVANNVCDQERLGAKKLDSWHPNQQVTPNDAHYL